MKINVVALGDSVAQKKNDRSCCVGTFDFVFVCVAVRFFLLCALVIYVYCRVIPDVLSLMFFHVPPLGFLK